MKVGNICPTALLEDLITPEEKYHLVLADIVVEDDDYAQFYRARLSQGDFVTLDSMEAERPGEGSSLEVMIEAFKKLGQPSEIVLPDVSDRRIETVHRSTEAANELQAAGFTGAFMGVPHGHNWREMEQCADDLVAIPGVECLGVYEQIRDNFQMSRADAAYQIKYLHREMDIHLLGGDEDCSTMLTPWCHHNCRGTDTAKLIVWGLTGNVVTAENIPPYPGRKAFGGEDYFRVTQADTNDKDLATAAENIAYWRKLTNPGGR